MLIDLAKKYITDVLEGNIVVGKKARQAVERHLSDLNRAEEKGWYFDETEAEIKLTCLSFFRHTSGAWARKPFDIRPEQAFIIYCVFGWKMKETEKRRFRKAYIRTPRKWGKSEFMAAIGLMMLLFDNEESAEVYSAATVRKQALKVFSPACTMMKLAQKEDSDLRKWVRVFESHNNMNITFDNDNIESYFQPISKDADSSEGSRPHCGIVDEYHLHKSDSVVSMLETGMITRSQPILWIITTAGFDTSSPCYEYDMTAAGILNGSKEIDRTFVIIFDMDDEDDWHDTANWQKANTGIPYNCPPLDALIDEHQKAKTEGFSKEIGFRVKNLNQWMSSTTGWIPDEFWLTCKKEFSFEDMRGRICYGGFDFASIRDLNSAFFLFPPEEEGEKFRLKWRIYCPAETIDDPKRNEGKAMYATWEKQGYLIRTDGNAADFDYIVDDVLHIASIVDIDLMGYDRKFALTPVTGLTTEGIEMEPVPQTYDGLTVPIKQVEMLALRGLLEVEKNPVIDWMMGNVALVFGDGDGVRISKLKSADKIDGIAAMLDGFNVFLKAYADPRRRVSVYEEIAQQGLILIK